MAYISDKLKQLGISKKDNSNPSDIWLIQDEDAAIEKINRVLERGTGRKTTSRLAELNAIMRVLFREKKVFGISLKKIGSGPAKIEFANDSKKSLEVQVKKISERDRFAFPAKTIFL